MSVVDQLRQARDAYERRDWMAAYDALSAADPASLRGDDFARLGTAALLLGRRNDCVQALQRAYQVNLETGDRLAAVRCAFYLARTLSQAGEPAVGSGWHARAERLLDGLPDDVVESGYLWCHRLITHLQAGEFDAARETADRIASFGRRFDNADLTAMGLCSQGRLMLYTGQVPQGVRLMDEAMVAVSTGELSPIFAGEVYCTLIEGCQEISDFGRVTEWTSVLTRWCSSQPDLVMFTGQCAVHRGQIMRLHGAYAEALDEFDRAVLRYQLAGLPAASGLAMAERGDVLRVLGDLDGAEESYAQAGQYGHEPQPGLALLRLAQGRRDAAAAAIRRLVAEPRDPVHRSQLLPAAVQVLLACDAAEEATALTVELEGLAGSFGCAALAAMADYAAASVALSQGRVVAVVPRLRGALRAWQALGARYEAARCRVLLGRIFQALDDPESAAGELALAHAELDGIGARPAADEVAGLLHPSTPGGLTARELEVLRLVAAGNSNPDIATSLVLSEKTVARHLSNIFGKLGVGSRTAAAAFAYKHDLA